MKWIGLDWDEGPYFQSENAAKHRHAALHLFNEGKAYFCECTPDQVKARNEANAIKTPGYDGECRDRGLEAAEGRALRFRTPDEGTLTRVDLIRGTTEIDVSTIEDFVILRGNGNPMFILANAFDDIDQRITHVIRGEEHLSNVPKAMLMWESLGGAELPAWAHVPVLVNEKRQKLSKRSDKVALEEYRDEGILPEAMRNYLAILGWSPGDNREIVTLEEMLNSFRLEDVTSSPAFFDEKKLRAFNADYIRALPEASFVVRSLPWLEGEDAPYPPENFDLEKFNRMAKEIQTRVDTLGEVPWWVDFLFLDEPEIDEKSWDKRIVNGASVADVLAGVLDGYEVCLWKSADIKAATIEVGERLGLGLTKAQFPVRVAITGRDVGPPLFESIEVLGRPATLERIKTALAKLSPAD